MKKGNNKMRILNYLDQLFYKSFTIHKLERLRENTKYK